MYGYTEIVNFEVLPKSLILQLTNDCISFFLPINKSYPTLSIQLIKFLS